MFCFSFSDLNSTKHSEYISKEYFWILFAVIHCFDSLPFIARIRLGSRAANSFVPYSVDRRRVSLVNNLSSSRRVIADGLEAAMAWL